MTEPALHVQMLGGFGLTLGNEPVPSIPKGPGSLLAYLILNRDREHTRDLLAGRFWSDTTDDKARRRLSQTLWQLNKRTRAAGLDLLTSTQNAVRFDPDMDVVLDVEIFERRLDDFERQFRTSRHTVSVADLSAIVDSYRGALLAGYYDDWISDEREALRNRYRAALGQLVSLTSNDGDYETALRHALALVGEEPFDEEAQREVLRLYALNGQPSVAERHFQKFATDLDNQLKATPSAETTDLIRRIVDEAASPPVGFADPEHGTSAFVGRRTERSSVLNRVIELAAGKGGVVLIEGEPGIGKTRLAEELAKGAEWRGAQVLVGCHAETSALTPYEGLKEALAPATSGLRSERLRDSVDALWLRQASDVLEGLGALVEGSDRQRLHPSEEPWRRNEALAQIILAQGRPKPTVLILEDIHRCDEDTIAVLTQLGDRLIDSQVLVCLTYQLHEAQASDAIWQGLSALEAEPGSSRVVVPPLQPDEVRELIVGELGPGRMSATMMDQLVKSTAGNPYMVLELLRSPVELLDDEAFDLPGDAGATRIDDHLLPRLTDIITRRIEAMPEAVRTVLEAVAALGTPAPPSVVAQSADLDRSTTLDALQRAVDLGFLVETERGCDFGQAQTRRVVYDEMAIERRSGLHGRIVDALTLVEHAATVEQVAHHAWLAGQWQRAYQYHSLAAESALEVNAYQTSAEHFNKADHAARSAGLLDVDRIADLFEHEAVLDILGRGTEQRRLLDRVESAAELDAPTSAKLQRRRAWLLLQSDDAAEGARLAAEAAETGRSAGVNVGELLTIVGIALLRSGKLSAAVEALEDAIAELRADDLGAVEAQLVLGRTHAELQEFDDAHRHLEDAYNGAKELDDPRGQVEALGHMAAMWNAQGIEGRAETAFTEALALARDIGYRDGEGKNLLNFAVFHSMHGRNGRSLGLLDDAGEVFASLGNRRGEAYVKANSSWVLHWIVGDDETAERQAQEAAAELRRLGDERTEAVCLNTIAGVERRAGRRRQAKRRLAHALDRAANAEDRDTEARVQLNLAMVELDLEHHEDALAHIAAAEQLRRRNHLDSFTSILAALEARARLGLGDTDAAAALTSRIIRANNQDAQLSHLAAWWCAEIFRATGREDAASEQVALAYNLLEQNLDGLPDALAAGAWVDVPEHKAIVHAREQYFVERVTWQVPSNEAPTGRPLVESDFVTISWTRSHPDDWQIESPVERRHRRVLRLLAEAAEQGGAARQSDVAAVLGVSERTIKRDLAEIRHSRRHDEPQ